MGLVADQAGQDRRFHPALPGRCADRPVKGRSLPHAGRRISGRRADQRVLSGFPHFQRRRYQGSDVQRRHRSRQRKPQPAAQDRSEPHRGRALLNRAKTHSLVSLSATTVDGKVDAGNFHSDSDVELGDGSEYKGSVSLGNAKISGNIELGGATFDDSLNAIWLQLGGALVAFSDNKAPTHFKDVHLEEANIAGLTFLGGSTIEGVLNGAQMTAATVDLLSIGDATSRFKSVSLVGANRTGSLNMAGATVEGAVDMGSLQIDGHVVLRDDGRGRANYHDVSLIGAKIGGNFDMMSAHVDGKLSLEAVQIGADLLLRCFTSRPATFK